MGSDVVIFTPSLASREQYHNIIFLGCSANDFLIISCRNEIVKIYHVTFFLNIPIKF